MFVVVLAVLFLGIVLWYLFPLLSGRKLNVVLAIGLTFLAVCMGMLQTPEISRKDAWVQSAGDVSGTLEEKEKTVQAFEQKLETLKEQILSSRTSGEVRGMMDEFRNLEKKADEARSQYYRRQYSAPNQF